MLSKKCKIIIVLLTIIYAFNVTLHAKEQQKRLFIKTFDTKEGISKSLADKFRDKLVLYFFEEGAGIYRVLSESDIRIMYKQAEELLKIGCNAEQCLIQIAYTIDADVIIYGKIERVESKINIFAQSLVRDRSSDELLKSSVVNISFYESQIDWYAKEIVKKLIDSNYFIDESKAPLEIKVDVSPELLKSTELKSEKLQILKFNVDDTALKTITGILKDIVLQGDNFYQKKDTKNSRAKYEEVIEKIETKISSDKQKKLIDFKEKVYDRIEATYSIEFQKILKSADKHFKNKDYKSAYNEYKSIDKQIDHIESTYPDVSKRLEYFKHIAKQRRDLIREIYAEKKILKGDTFYSDYKFEQAIDNYEKALRFLNAFEIKTNSKYIKYTKETGKKRDAVKNTGLSYFNNQVQSYCDKIDVYNLKNEDEKAKDMLIELYDLIQISKFTDYESRNKLKEMANLLNMSVDDIEKLKKEKKGARESQERELARKKASRVWYNKRFILDFESGSGHMFNTFFLYKLQRFNLGIGGAYTFDTEEIMGKKFNEHLFNIVASIDFHLMDSNFLWLDIREKIGYEWIKIDKWSERGTFLSTGLLIGYHYLFGELSVPMFFGRIGTAIDVQMGLGFRSRL